MSVLQFNVTYYPRLKVINDGQIRPAEKIIEMIRNAPQQIIQKQDKFRKTSNQNFKLWQPLVVWHASITGERVDASVTLTNGRIMLDLDKIKNPALLQRMMEYFRNDPHVILCCLSPSGKGIKVLYHTDVTDPAIYPSAYKMLCAQVAGVENFGDFVDWKTSNLSRGHFIVSDPNIYVNPDAEQLKLQELAKVNQHGYSLSQNGIISSSKRYVADSTATNSIISYPSKGSMIYSLTVLDAIYDYYKKNDLKVCNEYDEWMNHGYAIHSTINWDDQLAEQYFRNFSMLAPDGVFNETLFNKTLKSIRKHNHHKMTLGTIIWYAVKRGFPMEYELEDQNLSGFCERRRKVRITENPLEKHYKINNFLTDIQLDTSSNLHLIAATGSGKNHYFLNKAEGKRVLLVPTVDIVKQMWESFSGEDAASFVYEGLQVTGKEDVIVGTYDSIFKLNRYLDTSQYALWIDEVQNFFTSTALNYRNKVMGEILNSLPLYKNVVAMTGTDVPNEYLFPTNEGFSKIVVEQENPKEKQLTLVQTNDKLASIYSRLVHEKLNIILYNDKEKGTELAAVLRVKGYKTQLFNADTKSEEDHRDIVTSREVKQSVDVLIVTDIYKEGLSFLNRDVAGVHLLGWVSHLDIEQVHSRTRSANPPIYYYIKSDKTFAYHYYSLNKVLGERLEEANVVAEQLENVAPARYNDGYTPIAEEMEALRFHNPSSTLQYIDKTDDNGYRVNKPLIFNSVYNQMKSTEHKNIYMLLSELAAFNYSFNLKQDNFTLDDRLQSQDGKLSDQVIEDFLNHYNRYSAAELLKMETGAKVMDRLKGRLWYIKSYLRDDDVPAAFRVYGRSARAFTLFEYKLKMQLFYARRDKNKQTPLIISEFFRHFKVGERYSVKQVYMKLHKIQNETKLFGKRVLESKRPTSYLRRFFDVSTYESNGISYCRIASKNVTGFPLDMGKVESNGMVEHINIEDFMNMPEVRE